MTTRQVNGAEPTVISVVPMIAISLAEAKDRIKQMQQFVQALMEEGVDYGKIPGTPKPTLLKPGAEKLCDIYGFTKLVSFIEGQSWEDRETGHAQYTCKITLVSKRTGYTEAEGIGCCTTREKRFRDRRTNEYRDPWTERNAAQKMAKKRALVDAVLSATRSSGLFTQDIEDADDALANADTAYRNRQQAPPANVQRPRPAPEAIDTETGEVIDAEPTPTPKESAGPIHICEDCTLEITEAKDSSGALISGSVLAARTRGKFGRQLCAKCAKKVAQAG